MLPVFFALAGLKVNTEGKLFIGWFGPRGLASIVFAVIVVNANLPNSGALAMAVVCTVILSIILHGLSANPWAGGCGERSRRTRDGAYAHVRLVPTAPQTASRPWLKNNMKCIFACAIYFARIDGPACGYSTRIEPAVAIHEALD